MTTAGQSMRTDPNLADPDGFYEAWLRAHEGLGEDESNDLNARLVLLLANQIGDAATLKACIDEAARRSSPATTEIAPRA